LLCAPLLAEPLVARLAEPDPEPPDETAALERAECPNTAKSTAAPTIPADPTVAVSLRTRRSPSSRAATAWRTSSWRIRLPSAPGLPLRALTRLSAACFLIFVR
jgi:hypothetical protein